jgi:hypothetical protein
MKPVSRVKLVLRKSGDSQRPNSECMSPHCLRTWRCASTGGGYQLLGPAECPAGPRLGVSDTHLRRIPGTRLRIHPPGDSRHPPSGIPDTHLRVHSPAPGIPDAPPVSIRTWLAPSAQIQGPPAISNARSPRPTLPEGGCLTFPESGCLASQRKSEWRDLLVSRWQRWSSCPINDVVWLKYRRIARLLHNDRARRWDIWRQHGTGRNNFARLTHRRIVLLLNQEGAMRHRNEAPMKLDLRAIVAVVGRFKSCDILIANRAGFA